MRYVADVYPGAKLNPLPGGNVSIAPDHAALNFDRTPDGVDHTCELQQQTVAHSLHDAIAMRGDYRINYGHTNGFNRGQRPPRLRLSRE